MGVLSAGPLSDSSFLDSGTRGMYALKVTGAVGVTGPLSVDQVLELLFRRTPEQLFRAVIIESRRHISEF